jgi:TDG/mug DNA glycosylase family protein
MPSPTTCRPGGALPRLRLIAHNGGESARCDAHHAALGLPVLRCRRPARPTPAGRFERKRAAWRQAFEQAGLLG